MNDKFRKCTFENWDHNIGNEKLYQLDIKYTVKFQKLKAENQGLLIHGEPGNGETYLSACIANKLLRQLAPVICVGSIIMLKEIQKAIKNPDELYKIVVKLRTGYGLGEFNEEIVTETMDAINDAKVLNLVNALEKLQKMQRETLGILNEKDK
jgi:DNA helicase TIP49 (TBP-interacting protein)